MMSTWFPLFLSLFFLIHISLCFTRCIESERDALLEFKNGLTDPSNRLSNWVPEASDCCEWTGVVCHNLTFHVIELHLRTLSLQEYLGPDNYVVVAEHEYEEYDEYYRNLALGGKVSSSLIHLKNLRYLDLSCNDFGGVTIPEFIGSMRSLRYLNLSRAGFGGIIPPQLGNLSNLNYLNLYSNNFYDLEVENLDWVTNLSSLEFFDLSYVNLSRFTGWLKVMNSLPSLVELHLAGCDLLNFNPSSLPNLNFSSLSVLDLSGNHFAGPIPNGLRNMSSLLTDLDLSSNLFNSSIPTWLCDLIHLQILQLSSNELKGQISSCIGNLTSLVTLGMWNYRGLEFEKGIPNSFQNLCNLRVLAIPGIKLRQEINDVLSILSRCDSSVLQFLDVTNCRLSGHLTDDLSHFKNLRYFLLSYNSISGSIPLSFGNLQKLESVDISGTKLEGEVSQLHFANLTSLLRFTANDMKENISLRVSSNWIPPPKLQTICLGSWNIGSQFSEWGWLRLLKNMMNLQLTNCGISTSIPIWFWDLLPNYYYLDLSQNQMHGSLPNIPFAYAFKPVFDFSSNHFSAEVPSFSSNITALDLSHNSFSGSVSNFLCYKMNEQKKMTNLNLEANLLNGEIPDCWGTWRNLAAVKLSNNSFSGKIPNSIGSLSKLESLHFRNNDLSGEVPSSIQNCSLLFLLDVSENNLSGKIQTWIGDGFSRLTILDLHANKFDGYLFEELCGLVSLHVLDLSYNRFFGSIPGCFGKFNAMASVSDSDGSLYTDSTGKISESTPLLMKGKVMDYSTNLGFVRIIDLSNNNISGEIPREITNLTVLLSLNLSRNFLTGRIPENIDNMKWLEVIDFSHNQLFGEIPQSMSTMTFLGTLDLSYNNLSGRIPSGTQLQSFNVSSFMGNHLCGLPLNNTCNANNTQLDPHMEEDDDSGDESLDIWFYESMGFGFVFGFWIVVGSLVFIRKWRHCYFRYVYRLRELFC